MAVSPDIVVRFATRSVFRAEDRGDPRFYIFATLVSGALRFEVVARLTDGSRGAVTGRALFAEMMAHFGPGVRLILGDWKLAGGRTTNIDLFNRATTAGLNQSDAAALTWTGLRASEFGFDRITVLSTTPVGNSGPFSDVQVQFSR